MPTAFIVCVLYISMQLMLLVYISYLPPCILLVCIHEPDLLVLTLHLLMTSTYS
jgi:hypothetical protein